MPTSKPNRPFVTALGVGKLPSIVQNGVSYDTHKCAIPSVIDTTNQLTSVDKRILELGLKSISLSNKEKFDTLNSLTRLLNASIASLNSRLQVSLPAQRGSVRSLGPYVGLKAQIVRVSDQQACSIALKRPLSDAHLHRRKELSLLGIFKKVDKGDAFLFQSHTDYQRSGLKHLNTANYEVVTDPNLPNGVAEAKALIAKVSQTGSPSCKRLVRELLLNPSLLEGSRERYAYFQSKVHKPLDTDGLFKVRPIVDCFNTALSAADKIAAAFCSPLNRHIFTIASSSIEMVGDIHSICTVGYDAIFVTADVSDLYTNVPIDEGIEALAELLDEFAIGDRGQRELVISLLRICLHNNTFYFGPTKYRQLHGIPMGSNSAPILADAFLFSLERPLLERSTGIELFKRYRDDVFAIAIDSDSATRLLDEYGKLHHRIKLESETSNVSANVLNIRISKFEDGSLRTGVYFKPTNSLPLLHKKSNHPEAVLVAAISGRILNFVRICNNSADLFSAIFSLSGNAAKYGYNEAAILGIARKVILQCSDKPWPYTRPKSSFDCVQDYREATDVKFVRGLEPLYKAAKRRGHRLNIQLGSNLQRTLCRTKDF